MARVRKEQKNGKELHLLDALLKSQAPEEQILSDMVTFMGGFHTSAYYITWTFFYLAQNPEVQEKLFRDVKEKVGSEHVEKLRAYTLTSNSFMRQVLDEVLHMSTTVSFSAHYAVGPRFLGSSKLGYLTISSLRRGGIPLKVHV